jgi:pimeloyl-ACP methyl ester carboxylesterase
LDQQYWLDDDPEQVIGTYAGPTLFVTGAQDQIVGFEDQKDLLPHYPNAVFVTLDDAGHNVHIDRPEPVITLLRTWARCCSH